MRDEIITRVFDFSTAAKDFDKTHDNSFLDIICEELYSLILEMPD
jgi:hypothetical protein